MPYQIEVMSIGEDIYPLLKRSVDSLNGVQDQFNFYLTALGDRPTAIQFQRSQYLTSDLWNFLRQQRQQQSGHRPYIIAFITRPLRSQKYGNLFGSHEAVEGLAVATTFGTGQYVREESRYCCYYLVRYALSFINPYIKTHNEEAQKACYFHRKIFKPDIRASMDSGTVCDTCLQQLDAPPPASKAHRLSAAERDALLKMRQFVSNELPYAVVMKGGGVKGLAFAGALLEIERYFWFDRHVGTSAGAIAAVLLAAGYTPSELRDTLLKKNFRDFMDAALWKIPFNLLFRAGCFPGESFVQWVSQLLTLKMGLQSEVPMKALNGALVYASRRGTGTLPFDSSGERSETSAAFAARCSMSIPLFFVPQEVDGRRVFDGGLRNNFPLARFLKDHPRSHYVALYLGKPDPKSRRWFGSELVDIIVDGEERATVDQNRHNVVVIDTSPIGTVDFRMTDQEKTFLLLVGRAAALKFLHERKFDEGPTQLEVDEAHQAAETSRSEVLRLRRRKRMRIFWIFASLIVLALLYRFGALHLLKQLLQSLRVSIFG